MENSLKIRSFKATIEPILLYASECWTIDPTMCKQIDGCYTRLLKIATNISWKDKVINTQLHRGLPNITEVIKLRRLRLTCHCKAHRRNSTQLSCMETKEWHTKQREITQYIYRHIKE